MDSINTNIIALRKEAYRLWGLSPKNVIFNMPISTSSEEFSFKIDCSSELKSWPKAYVISLPYKKTLNRVIMPVLVIQKYADTEVVFPAWYDMPEELNDRMIDLLKKPVRQSLQWWQKMANIILPKRLRYSSEKNAEDYIFKVYSQDARKLVIRAT